MQELKNGNFLSINVNDYAKLQSFTKEELKKIPWASKIKKIGSELTYFGKPLIPRIFMQEYFKNIVPEKWKRNIRVD